MCAKWGECLGTPNVLRRKVLIDEIGTMVFSPQSEPKVLYSRIGRRSAKIGFILAWQAALLVISTPYGSLLRI